MQKLPGKSGLNSTVTQVTYDDEEEVFVVGYMDADNHPHRVGAEAVVLAVPAPIARQLAPEVLTPEQKSILEQIQYATYITVTLITEEPIFEQAFDLAVPDEYFFTDVYDSRWVEQFYIQPFADDGLSIMSVYIAPRTANDPSLMAMSDADVLEAMYTDLEKIFPGVRGKAIETDIERFEYAYPVMSPGAYKRLTRLHEITEEGLLLAGDYTIYPTFEAAMESGLLAAEKVVEQLGELTPIRAFLRHGE